MSQIADLLELMFISTVAMNIEHNELIYGLDVTSL